MQAYPTLKSHAKPRALIEGPMCPACIYLLPPFLVLCTPALAHGHLSVCDDVSISWAGLRDGPVCFLVKEQAPSCCCRGH